MNRSPLVNSGPTGAVIRVAAVLGLLIGLPASCSTAQSTNSPAGRLFELQIVGPDGKPVPDVTVEIRGGLAGTAQPIKRGKLLTFGGSGSMARTDDAGQLVVEVAKDPQRFVLSIKQPGYGPYWAEWNSQEHPQPIPERFILELDAGWPVGGMVVDEDGNPVEGAKVSPSIRFKKRPGDFNDLYTGDEIEVEADGKWRFDCVPASMRDVHVTINHADFMPARQTLTRSEFGIELAAEPSRKIELKRGVMIAGTVTDEGGSPIAGALVRTKFLNEIREAKTDNDGTYFLAGCEPRMTRIVASAKGWALELQEVRVDPGMAPVNFVMRPGGKIRVRVLDENDKPIPRTRIFFQKWRGSIEYFEFDHVNDRTDANGVWEWNEAPLDEFKADICRPDGMQLLEQPLVARDEEYVFHPPPALVISGSVVDAKTKQPISKFRVVPGMRWDNSQLFWSQREGYDATDGRYVVTRNRGHIAHMVRVEADGYQAAVSREIKSDEGNVTIDFELKPAKNITATILAPDGAPAAGAKVALGVAGSQIRIENGDIDDGSTYAARYVADDAGRISIPPQDKQFQLVVTHPMGFAHLDSSGAAIPDPVKLTAWARVEGVFRVGPKAAPNAGIDLNTNTIQSYGESVPSIFTHHQATTDAEGRFVFERVVPGEGRIGRRIVYMVDDGALEVASSKMVAANFPAGETTKLELGGDGWPVVGTLAPPDGHNEDILWNFARIQVRADIEQPKPPVPAEVQNDRQQYQAWFTEWRETEEGKAWRKEYDAYEKRRAASPYIHASVARDGTFRIDDVPPGNYVLDVDMNNRAAARLSNFRFIVPETEDVELAEPVDLGVVTLEPAPVRP